jgi:hypothetical protein
MIDNILKDAVRDSLDSMIVELDLMPVFPSLVWLWTWDQIQSQYEGDNLTPVFDKFWETADTEGWTLAYGTEAMSEHVTDWLIRNEFIGEED